jgi:predicted aconitase with swiveling domain
VERVIRGRVLVAGRASGDALVADQPLSFWGGYDQRTGEIIDRRHPLSGQTAKGRVLVIPGSRGSSTTSAVFLESVRLGTAPAAVVTSQVDNFLALASVVADEMFGTPVPIVMIDPRDHASIRDRQRVQIEPDGSITIPE